MPEIALRPGICTIGADPRFGDVEIDLHDPPLAPNRFDQDGEPGFQPFSEKAAALPEERVLGGLLADGRSAADAPAPGVALGRLEDRLPVEPAMRAEFAILSGNGSAGHVRVHRGKAHPVLVETMARQDVAHHRQRDWRRHELVSHHPQDGADDEIQNRPADDPAGAIEEIAIFARCHAAS